MVLTLRGGRGPRLSRRSRRSPRGLSESFFSTFFSDSAATGAFFFWTVFYNLESALFLVQQKIKSKRRMRRDYALGFHILVTIILPTFQNFIQQTFYQKVKILEFSFKKQS